MIEMDAIAPLSTGSTEVFKTGQWSSRKPVYVEGISPCRQACPIGIDIAQAVHLASQGEIGEALRVYREDNPLPGVCGRVCYHPCEGGCNRKNLDEPVNIRGLERFLSDHGEVGTPGEAAGRSRRERIAVIGSGPCGLSASYHLARQGFRVTVFESLPEPGGMLRYGIPAYRLPREVLEREVGHIGRLGVDIRTGVRVGRDVSFGEIRRGHRAVFLAAGAHRAAALGLEGEDLPGVMQGIGFLRRVHLGEQVRVGRFAVVVGGGNTALDCARTAKRLGAEEVVILYRRSRAEMPALAEDVEAAEQEGVRIEFLAAPAALVAEKGKLSRIHCIRMAQGPPDGSGRPQPIPMKGSEFSLPALTVIAAVGQVPALEFAGEAGVSLTRAGVLRISPESAETNLEGVFAGGDCAGSKAYVADAIAAGKMGAFAIACFLEGADIGRELPQRRLGAGPAFSLGKPDPKGGKRVDLKKVVGFPEINTLLFPRRARSQHPRSPRAEGGDAFREATGGLSRERMAEELSRCFQCGICTGCDLCFLLCPDVSIVKSGEGGYGVNADYCKGCSVCAASCPRHVIEMGRER